MKKDIAKLEAERYARRLSRLTLIELVKTIKVTEYKRLANKSGPVATHLRGVIYEIDLTFEDQDAIFYSFGVDKSKIDQKVISYFVPLLVKLIDSELKKDSSRMMEK